MPRKPKTIKELRESKELTIAEFARQIGVSASTISAYESGRSKPSEKVLSKIREVFGVELPAPKAARKVPGKAVEKPAAEAPEKNEKSEKTEKPEKKKAVFIIQSPMGGSITPEEILARIGEADTVYVRVDENRAYWVRGEETGSVALW